MFLSVVIPSYNAGIYLQQAIASVQSQVTDFHLNTEIIIVDDGSTDGSIEKIKQCDVKILYQNHQGAAAARNYGWSEARGEYLLFLDADDLLTEDAVQSLCDGLFENPDAAFCLSLAEEFISEEIDAETAATLYKKKIPFRGLLAGCCFGLKKSFDEIGKFDAKLSSGEIVEWLARLQGSELKTVQIEKVTMRRRIHLSNTGRVYHQEEVQNYAKILRQRMLAQRCKG